MPAGCPDCQLVVNIFILLLTSFNSIYKNYSCQLVSMRISYWLRAAQLGVIWEKSCIHNYSGLHSLKKLYDFQIWSSSDMHRILIDWRLFVRPIRAQLTITWFFGSYDVWIFTLSQTIKSPSSMCGSKTSFCVMQCKFNQEQSSSKS